MKAFFFTLSLLFTLNFLASCAITAQRSAQLTSWGETALTVATAFKAISPQDAALVRNHGALILADLTVVNTPDRVAKISNRAVTFAEEKGALNEAQAAALRDAGVVVLELTATK